MHNRIVGVLALVLGLVAPCTGESDALRFFPCAVVQFFGEACAPSAVPVVPVLEATSGLPLTPSSTPSRLPLVPGAERVASATSAVPPPPLFAPETVSPDMPPLLLQLLQEPTEANAHAFLAWQHARLQRLWEVQALLRALQAAEAESPSPSQGSWNTHTRP